MKIGITGHITIDTIVCEGESRISLGGPPCYAGLIARSMGSDVAVITKVGYDFPEEYFMWLARNQIRLEESFRSLDHPTTRFKIVRSSTGRTLYLISRCEPISPTQFAEHSYDAVVINPIAGEISIEVLKAVKKASGLVYIDPQGFIRRFEKDGRCVIGEVDPDFVRYADVLKVDREEAKALTGIENIYDAVQRLSRYGPKIVIGTLASREVSVVSERSITRIPLKRFDVVDDTGAGDIFGGAFVSVYLESEDPIRSVGIGAAAASLSVQYAGVAKIPERDSIMKLADELLKKIERRFL